MPGSQPLRDIAQTDLDEIRARAGSGRAWFARSRIVVLPDRLMRRLGGAAAIYQCVCVSDSLLHAPEPVRRAIIAHEWGHIAAGHCNATTAAMVLLAVYGVVTWTAPSDAAWLIVDTVLLVSVAGLALWALHPKREFEADAVAAQAVGADAVAQALRWMVARLRSGRFTPELRKRLRRLETYTRLRHGLHEPDLGAP